MYAKFAITATTLIATASAMPAQLVARFSDSYTGYRGDGSTGQGWPAMSAWGSFDQLWNANYPLMQKSCGWNG
jgi:hypothetical protein